ncbi:MAG: hypothetical protein ACE5HL_11005 [Terriglobia bacterium]
MSIFFSKRLPERIQKIEIQRLGINLGIDAVTLFVMVGLGITLLGFYPFLRDVKEMSGEIAKLERQLADAKQGLTELRWRFTLEPTSKGFRHDENVEYSHTIKETEGGEASELIPLACREEVTFDTEGRERHELQCWAKLKANDIVIIQAQRGERRWQSRPFRPSTGHRVRMFERAATMPVTATPAPGIPSPTPLEPKPVVEPPP